MAFAAAAAAAASRCAACAASASREAASAAASCVVSAAAVLCSSAARADASARFAVQHSVAVPSSARTASRSRVAFARTSSRCATHAWREVNPTTTAAASVMRSNATLATVTELALGAATELAFVGATAAASRRAGLAARRAFCAITNAQSGSVKWMLY